MTRVVRTILGVGILLTYTVPLFWLVVTSIKPNQDVVARSASLVFTPTLEGYRSAIAQGVLGSAVSTILIAAMTVAGCLLLGLPTAYGLAQSRSRLVPVGLALLIILQMMPQTATLIPLYQVLGSWGLLGGMSGLVVADIAMMLPFTVILLRPFFAAVPPQLEEAAALDGASRIRTFVWIVLPVVRNGVMTVAILVFILISGEFLYAVNFLTDPSQYPLSATVAQQVSQYGISWSTLMAIAVIASIPTLIVFAVGQRALVRGISLGAVK